MTDEEHEAWKASDRAKAADLAAINQAWFRYQIERMGRPLETHQVAFVAGYRAHAAEPPQPAGGVAEERPTVGQHGSIVGSGRYVGMYARVVDVYQQGLDVVLNNGRRLVLMDSEFQADPPKPAEPPHPSNEELVATVRDGLRGGRTWRDEEAATASLSELERRLTVKA